MTYAYDDYILMPTKDLYDTAVMKMAIEAAKDMYDKGQALMENFYKTYGDFMSPFAEDMKVYGTAMNNVRQTINDAYARGIDLFKSPEGRAIVAQLSHSIDPMWYNTARQNAKVGYAYLDAVKEAVRKGEYDEGLENFILNQEGGLGSFANFSSKGGRIWDRTAPSRFQDINQWTHHLFDNMELSYDPELSKKYPGYLAYSKNKDVMNTIAANNLATLADTDLGKYMISRYEDQFKALGYSDSDAAKAAVDMLQKNIVNSNWEQSQIKLQEDPYYAANLGLENQKTLEAIKHEHAKELKRIEHLNNLELYGIKYGDQTGSPGSANPYTSWVGRQRQAISGNMNGDAEQINALLKGASYDGAKEILRNQGVNKPTPEQIKNVMAENQKKFRELLTGYITPEKLEKINAYYDAYKTVPTGEDQLTAVALAANLNPEEPVNDIESGVKRRPISFNSTGHPLYLTRQRQYAYLGIDPGSRSVTEKLYKYLVKNNIQGYMSSNDVSVNRMPYGNRSSLDINFNIRIKRSDLAKFEEENKESFNNIMQTIGASFVTAPGQRVSDANNSEDPGKLVWDNIEYIDIPCTRHIDSTKLTDAMIDKYHISLTRTKSAAAKTEGSIYNNE